MNRKVNSIGSVIPATIAVKVRLPLWENAETCRQTILEFILRARGVFYEWSACS
ncbi:hypothetical protein J7E63_14980 [Bacillus sp. ISL-75]|nr:hypothetical protein [Bacillus sp. ISL-75]